MHRLANPTRFLKLASAVLPFAAAITAICIGAGLVLGLVFSPPDYQQGDTVRIMYVHVPAAIMAQYVFFGMAVASAVALIWKHAVADLIAKASAPVGLVFCFLCLLTGALWGQPTWGTWWIWDARLTSVLILLFLYVGYIALWQAFDDESKAARAAAILTLVGAVNIPVIQFSVEWWNTLHQGRTILTAEGPKLDNAMLWPLLLMIVGFMSYYVTVLAYRVRAEIYQRQTRMMQMAQAARAEQAAAMQPAE